MAKLVRELMKGNKKKAAKKKKKKTIASSPSMTKSTSKSTLRKKTPSPDKLEEKKLQALRDAMKNVEETKNKPRQSMIVSKAPVVMSNSGGVISIG